MHAFPRWLGRLSRLLLRGAEHRRRPEARERFFRPVAEGLEKRYAPAGGTLTISDAQENEEAGTMSFQVLFSGDFPGGFSVAWSTANGTATAGESYTAASGTLNFSGESEIKAITITLLDDTMVEPTRDFQVNLGAVTGDPGGDITVSDGSATGQIANTDTAVVLLEFASGSSSSANEGTSGTGSHVVTFEVSLSNPVSVPVSVDWATFDVDAEDGTDYVGDSGDFYLTNTLPESFTVTVNHDTIVELNDTFGVQLSNLNAGSLSNFVSIGTSRYHSILNDDQATVSIDPPALSYIENTTTITLGVQLAGRVDHEVGLDIISAAGTASADTGDYTVLSTHVTFEAYPDNTDSTQTQNFQFQILEDNWDEAQFESFTILIVNNISAGGRNVVISGTAGSRIVTIEDDDAATITINNVSAAEETHPSTYTEFAFTVTLSQPVDTAFTVEYYTVAVSAVAASDFVHVGTPVSITFQPGQLTKTIVIDVVADSNDDANNETFEVRLTNLVATGRDVTISNDTGIGTIQDDD